jgi:hypothetical protein
MNGGEGEQCPLRGGREQVMFVTLTLNPYGRGTFNPAPLLPWGEGSGTDSIHIAYLQDYWIEVEGKNLDFCYYHDPTLALSQKFHS